ncbi:hypothetical protein [Halarcobacter anaerophilus]|uniref:Uncharacterized protein n=1 Tax=Halarcobacter anaerophilus TaxID=877500 RepID=A0A4Q0Y2Y6_9BACT|nr:hypothetical protein [Halarcobacter anaerophilus]QDF28949.1 hypothetical protein AANAER_1469 [Halarcobacter anaerophilus]RXJ63584.1 hypothetical protein CRV06_05170 [Halarcobacter anaerophilus]
MTKLNIKMRDTEVSVETDFGANDIVKLITGIEQSKNIIPIVTLTTEMTKQEEIYSIGKVGTKGFGVAAIEDTYLPKGFKKLKGHDDIDSDNYGNVLDNNGSQLVWIPRFYFKWTSKNKCKISDYQKEGYALHEMFYDGGMQLRGIFVDKYECGNIDGIFASKEGIEPCSTRGNNSITDLKNNPSETYGGLYKAVKTRGQNYNLTTLFTYNGLSMLMFANNNNSLEKIKYHNNQKCGVFWIDPYRYEVASGFIKLNNNDSIFKVISKDVKIKDFKDDKDAYNPDFYDDIDLSGVVDGDDFWVFLDDKVQTFSMEDTKKTCLGIPRAEALSSESNDTYANAGMYRYLRDEMAPIVGTWGDSSAAGAFAMNLYYSRTYSYYYVGGRASFNVPMSGTNDSE